MSSPTLTDEQVVRMLAEREGWYDIERRRDDWEQTGRHKMKRDEFAHLLPPYLTSRDALAPVLEGLSGDEWHCLHEAIYELSGCDGLQQRRMAYFCLTMPARDLAHAVASVLVASREGDK